MDATHAAFAAYYREHYPAIARFAERRIDDREAAAEIAADVFRLVWTKRTGDTFPGRAWLLVTARNLLGNAYRARERRRALEEKAVAAVRAAPDATGDHELLSAVFEAIGPRHSEVLRLAYWDGLTGEDLGLLLGCSANAAHIRLHRARRAAEAAVVRMDAEETRA
jgi:RNA polymerase sigma-70 factor (ECF subfamily)